MLWSVAPGCYPMQWKGLPNQSEFILCNAYGSLGCANPTSPGKVAQMDIWQYRPIMPIIFDPQSFLTEPRNPHAILTGAPFDSLGIDVCFIAVSADIWLQAVHRACQCQRCGRVISVGDWSSSNMFTRSCMLRKGSKNHCVPKFPNAPNTLSLEKL